MRFAHHSDTFGKPYGYFEFNQFPGCAQLLVSNHSYIKPEERNKGYGEAQQRIKLDMAAELGYNCIICTVHADNIPEISILKKNNWKFVHDFHNTETNKTIQIWIRNI